MTGLTTDAMREMLERTRAAASSLSANSRYLRVEKAEGPGPGGGRVAFLRRRFLPPLDADAAAATRVVSEGERLDHIARDALGDPERFWAVCDLNPVLRPNDLVATPGATIRVPSQGGGNG